MRYTEVRWHGRAQQGVVTAAKLLAESALVEGKYVQAFPEFGPERMGAPVRAFDRISDEPIALHCQVTNPDIVLIADATLIGMALSGGMESAGSVVSGTGKDTVFIVNSPLSPVKMREKLGIKLGEEPTGEPARRTGRLDRGGKVFTLDASRISMETIGRHMPNTAMLGALAKVTGLIKFSSVIDNFRTNYSKKFSSKIIDANIMALERGYEEVKGE